MEQHSLDIGTDLDIGHGNRRRERRSDGTEPSGGATTGGPQTGEARSKPLSLAIKRQGLIGARA
jgi:hypothetical protein